MGQINAGGRTSGVSMKERYKLKSEGDGREMCACQAFGLDYIGNNNVGCEVWACPSCKRWEIYADGFEQFDNMTPGLE